MEYDHSVLNSLPVEERLSKAHPFLKQVLSLAKGLCDPESILLFGSRARGDQRPDSDFDLAFKGITHDGG